ncbi:MAG: formate transporter FocA [candidate division SR1 bacterium]|nr:MAG: formate transporter FocA [candidate division SR1 bacterium]
MMNTPKEVTKIAENVGKYKANNRLSKTVVSSILAGMFIAFGGVFTVNSITGLGGVIPFGITKLIYGLTFSLGLILVMVAGAELFTGNSLLIVAFLNKKIGGLKFLKNLLLVWIFNFVGVLIIVTMLVLGKWYLGADSDIATLSLNIGLHKLEYSFVQAFVLGILCNIFVCLAVRLSWTAKTVSGKILAIIFPITAFVGLGFEHSVANMYYLSFAWILKTLGLGANLHGIVTLTWSNIFVHNLLPVTLGNIVGGAIFVGLLYWFLYGREK